MEKKLLLKERECLKKKCVNNEDIMDKIDGTDVCDRLSKPR